MSASPLEPLIILLEKKRKESAMCIPTLWPSLRLAGPHAHKVLLQREAPQLSSQGFRKSRRRGLEVESRPVLQFRHVPALALTLLLDLSLVSENLGLCR